MSKKSRQYIGILGAVLAYYVIHEGAHLVCACMMGVFRGIRFLGLGMQIDVHADKLTDSEMGIFCLAGAAATLAAGLILTGLSERIGRLQSKVLRAVFYYTTMALLLLDPLYLSLLCGFFGGGDMNGIALMVPEIPARIVFFLLLLVNLLLNIKVVLPVYSRSFQESTD